MTLNVQSWFFFDFSKLDTTIIAFLFKDQFSANKTGFRPGESETMYVSLCPFHYVCFIMYASLTMQYARYGSV